MDCVHHDGAESVTGIRQCAAYRSEVLTVMGTQRAADVFQHHQARRPAFFFQLAHQFPEWPKGAGALAFKTRPDARQR